MVTEEWQCHVNYGNVHEVHTFTSEEEARAWTESPRMHVRAPKGGFGSIRWYTMHVFKHVHEPAPKARKARAKQDG